MLECCSLLFTRKIAESFMKRSIFWAAKATKIIKILDLFKNADISKIFLLNFNVLIKRYPKVCFYPIKTKYKCQETEKVELDNSM